MTGGVIAATDSILIAFGKLQKQISDALVSITLKANDNEVVHLAGIETITGKKILSPTLIASANNEVLIGLDIAPVFINGAFTGVSNYSLRHSSDIIPSSQGTINLGTASLGYGIINVTKLMAMSGYNIEIQPGGTSNYTLFRVSRSGTEIARFAPTTGNLILQNGGTFTDDLTNKLQVNGSIKATQFRLSALNTAPASATATGVLGEIRYDANYMYVCVATNTWKRSALTTW